MFVCVMCMANFFWWDSYYFMTFDNLFNCFYFCFHEFYWIIMNKSLKCFSNHIFLYSIKNYILLFEIVVLYSVNLSRLKFIFVQKLFIIKYFEKRKKRKIICKNEFVWNWTLYNQVNIIQTVYHKTDSIYNNFKNNKHN